MNESSIGSLAVATFAKLCDRIGKYRKKSRDEDNPEPIHQLRVNLRKLRAAIALFDQIIELPKELADKNIARVARAFGKKRDNDVLIERFKETPGAARDDVVTDRVMKKFEQIDKKAAKSIRRALKGKAFDAIYDSLESWVEHPKLAATAITPAGESIANALQPARQAVEAHEGWGIIHTIDAASEIETLFGEPGDTLHDLRKKAKRLRYQMEFAEPAVGKENKHRLESLKFLQDHLGAVQDLRTLKAFLDDTFDGSGWQVELHSVFEHILSSIRKEIRMLQESGK